MFLQTAVTFCHNVQLPNGRPGDISSSFCGDPEAAIFSLEVGPSTSVIVASKTGFFKPNHYFATTFVPKPNHTISTALWRERIKFNPNKQKVRTLSFKSNLSVVLQKHAIMYSGDLVAVWRFPGLFQPPKTDILDRKSGILVHLQLCLWWIKAGCF